MVKTKKVSSRYPLIVSGYILFTLLVIAVILTSIPQGIMLFDPRVIRYNVASSMIALAIGNLLPSFLAYTIGNHSIKSKNKTSHHFNGMLLGLLAFWIMSIFSVIVLIPAEHFSLPFAVRQILVNLLPSVAVAIITSIIAIFHVRGLQAKRDILEYKPYAVLLIGLTVLLPVWSLINSIFTLNVNMYSFVALIVAVILGLISLATLRNCKLSIFTKITWSAISISVAYVALFVLSPLIASLSNYINERSSMELMAVENYTVWVLALIVWILFWHAQVKSLSKN